ncbi:MAG: hypothetical protein WBO43_15845 [Gemmatimonadota bacterium]
MKSGLTAAILASITVLTGTSDLVAQQDVSMSIDGFNGIEWGSSEADVLERFGEPAQIDSLENGIIVLAYRVELIGEPAVAFYAFLGDEGMIKGQHIVKLKLDEGNCEGQYRVYRDHVTLTYPLIPPVENYDYPFTEDFCTALLNGRGNWANQWADPKNGAVVTVIVQEGTDEVKLIYESATFLNWLAP